MRTLLRVALLCALLPACEGTVSALGNGEQLPGGNSSAPIIQSFECTPLTVPATVNVTCDAFVTDPNNRPLFCTLSTSDGRVVVQGVDCTNFSQQVSFPTPGMVQVKLTAANDMSGSSDQSVSLTVNARPNYPPVVGSFTATPATGTVPFSTTFAWAASDPDGDPLKCDLDVGADGTLEFADLDCAVGMQAWQVSTAGAATVKLTAKDGHGGVTSATLTLTGRTAVGDVALASVDWGQTIVAANPKLVANKDALLKAHVTGSPGGITGVVVQVEGFAMGGTSLGKLTLAGPASPPTADAPNDLSQQYTVNIPAAWVQPGFSVKVTVDPLDAIAETNEMNNAATVTPQVGKASVLHLESVPVVLGGVTAATPDITETMTRVWPLQGIDNQTHAPYSGGAEPGATDVNAWGALLQDIATLQSADGSSRDYYGFLSLSYQAGIAGLGYVGQPAAIGRDDSTLTAAHELGHNMGRQHAPCGGAASPDPAYPYAGASIGVLGYDWKNKQLLGPGQYTDLMGYCQPAWVSDYNYNAVQTALETQAFVAQGPSMYAPVWLVRGSVDVDGRVSLRPVLPLFAAPTRAPASSPYVLELGFAEGVEEVPLRLDEVMDGDGARHFTALVPDRGGLWSLTVRYLGQAMLSRAVLPARGAATVERDAAHATARVRWDAAAFPVAALAHFDAAGQRTTLALELRGGDVTVPLGALEGGRFEVSLAGPLRSARVEVP